LLICFYRMSLMQVYSRKTRRKSGHQQTTVYGKQTAVVGADRLVS
jgi:hypothetical protein